MTAQHPAISTLRVAAFAAIYLLWGGSYLAIRSVVQTIPPFLTGAIRYSLSAIILLAISFVVFETPFPGLRRLWNCTSTGVVLFVFGYSAIYWAETRLASWLVAVLSSSGLLWTTLLEPMILATYKPRVATLLPLVSGLAGIFLLVTSSSNLDPPGSRVAAILVLASVIVWSTMTILFKRIDLGHGFLQTAGLQLTGAGSAMFLLSLVLGEWHRLPDADHLLRTAPLLGMTYLVIGGSVVAFTAFHWLLAHEAPSMVATTAYVNPIVAMIAGILFFHERYAGRQLMGAVTVLGCVVAVWYSKTPKRRGDSIAPQGRPAASR